MTTLLTAAPSEDLRTVRVTFSAAVDTTALGVAAWSFEGLGPAPFALPLALAVESVDSDTAPTAVDVTASMEFSPGASYRVVATGVTGVSAPSNEAEFVALVPDAPANRALSFWSWIPDKNKRDDDTGDLRKFISCFDEALLLLLHDSDRWADIQDPDLAVEKFVDQMLADFGNPFDEVLLTLAEKRRLIRTLIAIFKVIGTWPGIRDTIRFLLGVESEITVANGQGMRLGQSLLTVDWVLGCGPNKWYMVIRVLTPAGRAFSDYETRVLGQIIATMHCAEEEVVVQAALPAPANPSTAATGTPHGITVSWLAVTGATAYAVYMRSTAGATTRNASRHAAPGTSLALPMLPGLRRYFVATAINAQGEGLASVEVNAVSG